MTRRAVSQISELLLITAVSAAAACSTSNGAQNEGTAGNQQVGGGGTSSAGASGQGAAAGRSEVGGSTAEGGHPTTAGSSAGGDVTVGGDSAAGGDAAGGAAPRGPGQDFYCDPVKGLPTNAGSVESPWRRLEEVFAAGKTFANGDIIHLRTGNHGDPVIKGSIATGGRSIVTESGQTALFKSIHFAKGATSWTVDGVVVSPNEADGSLTTDALVQFDAGATHNVFENSELRYALDAVAQTWDNAAWLKNSGTAIYVIGSDNQIIGNRIRNTHNGIMLERKPPPEAGATGSLVRGNSVDHFWEDAYRGKVSDCTFEYNSATNSYAVVPVGMEAEPPHRDMFQSYRGDGTFVSIDNVILRGNVFIARQGVRYDKLPFVYDNHYTIQGLSAFDGPYRGWTIENNVIMVEVGLAMGLLGISDSKIVNNTVVPDSFGMDSEIRVTSRKDGTPSTGNVIVNNLAHTLNIGDAMGGTKSNNVAVPTQSYGDFFANYLAGDLHLKAGSPAIDAGTKTNASTTDADGALRTGTIDVGAYEFDAAKP